MPAQKHHQLRFGMRQTQQGAGHGLFIDLREMLGASRIFDDHFAVHLDARVAGFFRFFFRVDENQIEIGFVALIQRQKIADDLAHISQPRVLLGRINRDIDRPGELFDDVYAARGQAVAGGISHVALYVMTCREITQSASRSYEQQGDQHVAQGFIVNDFRQHGLSVNAVVVETLHGQQQKSGAEQNEEGRIAAVQQSEIEILKMIER
jgi:hypothetical protein